MYCLLLAWANLEPDSEAINECKRLTCARWHAQKSQLGAHIWTWTQEWLHYRCNFEGDDIFGGPRYLWFHVSKCKNVMESVVSAIILKCVSGTVHIEYISKGVWIIIVCNTSMTSRRVRWRRYQWHGKAISLYELLLILTLLRRYRGKERISVCIRGTPYVCMHYSIQSTFHFVY